MWPAIAIIRTERPGHTKPTLHNGTSRKKGFTRQDAAEEAGRSSSRTRFPLPEAMLQGLAPRLAPISMSAFSATDPAGPSLPKSWPEM